jgi:hypothetical protein
MRWNLFIILPCCGCSTYTLERISPADAGADYRDGVAYRVAYRDAVLVPSMEFATIGFGQPKLELDTQEIPQIGRNAVARLPRGTMVYIDRYVRYDEHGLYDCGNNGWTFAIAHVVDGELAGKTFLIDCHQLDLQSHTGSLLLERPPPPLPPRPRRIRADFQLPIGD